MSIPLPNQVNGLDWPSAEAEAVRLLQRLLQFDTTNPPGNELPAAQWLADVLAQDGIESVILESQPTRANLVARLAGRGEGRPILLLSHLDVVLAEAARWTHPPFSGDLADGCIWGRGAIDMKSLTVQQAMTMLLMKRHGLVPPRDLILCAVADEEIGGTWGAQWLVDNHPDLIRAEYAINEGGGYSLNIAGQRVYPIEAAQKHGCGLRLRATGEPGHGSMPHDRNANLRLARAVSKLTSTATPLHVTPIARAFVEGLAQRLPRTQALALRQLLNPRLNAAVSRLLPDPTVARALNAMLRNTVSPTILRGGEKGNVIPGEAYADLDCRLLPGQTCADVVREIQRIIGRGYEFEVLLSGDAPVLPYDTPMYRAIVRTLERADPGGAVLPYLFPAASDSRFLPKLGIQPYGFQPMRMPPGLSAVSLAHAHDERIPVEAFTFGLHALFDLLLNPI